MKGRKKEWQKETKEGKIKKQIKKKRRKEESESSTETEFVRFQLCVCACMCVSMLKDHCQTESHGDMILCIDFGLTHSK